MKCFFHTDMDGKCAGAIVFQVLGEGEYIPINYNHQFPFDTIQENEKVVIVDFSLQKEGEFERLMAITKDIIWIDHHKTAIEKHKNIEDQIKGLRESGAAGCVLAYRYFIGQSPSAIPLPIIVEMLGDYDIWDFSHHTETELSKLQSAVRLYDTRPESPIWNEWLNGGLDVLVPLLEKGGIVLKYRNEVWASLIKSWSFESEFEGHKSICCNAGSVSSQLFDSVERKYDLMIPFVYDGKQWTVSLYSKTIDVSEIAKKYGGGGHKGAAGFQCNQLPFKSFNK